MTYIQIYLQHIHNIFIYIILCIMLRYLMAIKFFKNKYNIPKMNNIIILSNKNMIINTFLYLTKYN